LDKRPQIIKRIKELFLSQNLAILATQNKGQPYTSLVSFASSDNLKQIFFVTPQYTRKYMNLSADSRVSMLVDNRSNKASDIGKAIAVTVIGDAEEIQGAVDIALKTFTKIDILVNNAGISPILKKAEEVTLKEWEEIVRVNLTGTFFFCQAVGKMMIQQGGGKIINMVSVGAVVGFSRQIAYCATKGGILQLTKVLAIEWTRYNIQVNAIGPAYLETELTKGMRESKIISDNLLQRTPMGRFGKPEEIVGAAIYLASEASSYVTGQTVFVDGGWLAL